MCFKYYKILLSLRGNIDQLDIDLLIACNRMLLKDKQVKFELHFWPL